MTFRTNQFPASLVVAFGIIQIADMQSNANAAFALIRVRARGCVRVEVVELCAHDRFLKPFPPKIAHCT